MPQHPPQFPVVLHSPERLRSRTCTRALCVTSTIDIAGVTDAVLLVYQKGCRSIDFMGIFNRHSVVDCQVPASQGRVGCVYGMGMM